MRSKVAAGWPVAERARMLGLLARPGESARRPASNARGVVLGRNGIQPR
ncbi:uncharacterized protein AruCF_3343 [Achromobacter ruhlandii]|nr:uncharacterized protein AruCF_3343 [Achromobacter ruhlandii]